MAPRSDVLGLFQGKLRSSRQGQLKGAVWQRYLFLRFLF
jgi:hypothetical protein